MQWEDFILGDVVSIDHHQYTTRRSTIVAALVKEKLKGINKLGNFLQDVFNNIHPKLLFWDELVNAKRRMK